MRASRLLPALLLLSVVPAAACDGSIHGGAADGAQRGPGRKGSGSAANGAAGGGGTGAHDDDDGIAEPETDLAQRPPKFTCDDPESIGKSQLAMRRLTRDELLASIGSVVGDKVMDAEAVVRAAARIPQEPPGDAVTSFQNGFAYDHVEGILLTAQAIADAVAADADARVGVFGACAETADRACATAFLDAAALRLLRRPLDAPRRDALLAAFDAEGAGLPGMRWILARVLQAPESVFHLELPRRDCTPAAVAEPSEYAWDDASVFFAPEGGEQRGPEAELSQAGWYVWQIPAERVTQDYAELTIDVFVSPGDAASIAVDVNLDDAPLLADSALAAGEQTLRAAVSIAAGTPIKVGVHFKNVTAGQSLELRTLALTGAPGALDCDDVAPSDGVFTLDDWSVASRVAYALTGQGPDAALLAAAQKGELRDEKHVRPHAERLIATDAARRQLEALFDSWLNLHAIPTPHPAIAARMDVDAEGLADEARRELLDYATYMILDRDADTAELMTARVGFPRSERMAALYGTEIAKGKEPVELENGHGGLLLRIAPLLSGQLSSSPILRGVYVRKRVLCDELPSPDFKIVNTRLAQFEAVDRTKLSTRQAVTQITSEGACPTCHTRINPLGFALEAFDPLGQPRAEEIVFDDDGAEIARHAIDADVTDANIEAGGATVLHGAAELNSALADSAKVRACIAERLYTEARLRPALPADACALSEVEQVLRDGGSIKEAWLRAVVNAELFVRKAEDAP